MLAFVVICVGWLLPEPALIFMGFAGFIGIGLSLNLLYRTSRPRKEEVEEKGGQRIFEIFVRLGGWCGVASFTGIGLGFLRYGIPSKEIATIVLGIIFIIVGIGTSIILIKRGRVL